MAVIFVDLNNHFQRQSLDCNIFRLIYILQS